MVIEWLLGLASNAVDWFISLLPTVDAPVFLTTLDDQLNAVFRQIGGAAVWVDWNYELAVLLTVLGVYLLSLVVKIIRAIASYIPLFGGAG